MFVCPCPAKLEELGDAPLRALLSGLGGWPMVNQSAWTEETFDLTGKLVELFLMHNTKPILTSYVYTDLKNSSERIIYVSGFLVWVAGGWTGVLDGWVGNRMGVFEGWVGDRMGVFDGCIGERIYVCWVRRRHDDI